MLTRRDLLYSAVTAGLAAPWMKLSPVLARRGSATGPSLLKSENIDDPQNFHHHFATVNDIRMHYVEEGQGPLVILLHGYPFLWYLWRHQLKPLAAAGYRVVAVDQRGYGQTDCPPDVASYDITHLVGDVVGLMKALDSKSAVLVGQDNDYEHSRSREPPNVGTLQSNPNRGEAHCFRCHRRAGF